MAQHLVLRDVGLVVVGHVRAPGGERLAGRALAGGEREALPLLGHVVAGGGDAARLGVAEVDAAHVRVDGQAGLAGERVQDLGEVERRVQRAGGADERLVLAGARAGALLGLETGDAGGGLVGERAREQDLVLGELPARAEDGDRDVADLAAPRDRDEQHGFDAEALDEVRPQVGDPGASTTWNGSAGGDHAGDARRPALEELHVAGVLDAVDAHHVGLADAGGLADLEQQDLVDLERLVERLGQLGVDRPDGGAWTAAAASRRSQRAASRPGRRGGDAGRGSGERIGTRGPSRVPGLSQVSAAPQRP